LDVSHLEPETAIGFQLVGFFQFFETEHPAVKLPRTLFFAEGDAKLYVI
jgi:hypothetical protein